MAEAILRSIAGDEYEVYSAGADPAAEIHPMAVEAMKEIGIDLSAQRPRSVEAFAGMEFHRVISLCDGSGEECPSLPGSEPVCWRFEDPASLEAAGSQKQRAFARLRQELKTRLDLWLIIDRRRSDLTGSARAGR